ncbi:hypothetical protein FOL47_009095 [Perkinsus chesapeaki]|uniref:Major facilitator superfamily (MFS) profile domain-containing protein n=1 Tax=Perkinsus chesapeaki TaxID=330153 RepID=A0A7J6LAN0_PERCH|nr:hypothetical protein FOL47_009095 [Perkinsus chesapeaki]
MRVERSISSSSVTSSSNYVEDIIDAIGYGRFQYCLLLLCSSGYFALYADLPVFVFIQSGLMEEYNLTPTTYAIFPFLASFVGMLSSTAFGYISDRYGRKWPSIATIFLTALGGMVSSFAWSFWSLIMFRMIVAMALGGICALDYVVYVEFTPESRRGFYSTVIFIGGCLGVVYLAGVNLFDLSFAGVSQWRVLLVLAAVPLIPTGVACWYFRCETPRYLMSRRKVAEAHAVLSRMAKANHCPPGTVPDLDEFIARTDEDFVEGKSGTSGTGELGFFEALREIYHGDEFLRVMSCAH